LNKMAKKKAAKKGKKLEVGKLVKKHLNKIVFLAMLVLIVWLWTSRNAPTEVLTSEGESRPLKPLDNELHFGWDYKDDYSSHNFVCRTCCCDKSRKDHVYVSYGDVEFDLRGAANRTNIVTISVEKLNENCRRNDIFINGMLVGNLNKETNGTPKADFRFNVTPPSDIVHVKVEMVADPDRCWWGNDLSKARIDVI